MAQSKYFSFPIWKTTGSIMFLCYFIIKAIRNKNLLQLCFAEINKALLLV